ncbi:hypothetical protein BHE74_00042101 [Ensete ventricosum]|nr:hypothetical protein BHE74_00042101 [Ensete ventricosum]RZR80582.1 hypothetical protein BHM03_00006617 [Ensete ventricosum]
MGRWRTSLLPPPQGAYRMVCGAISDEIAAVIVAQLLFQEFQNPSKTINMYINSPSGAVTAGLAIYNTMQYISSPVSTLCLRLPLWGPSS